MGHCDVHRVRRARRVRRVWRLPLATCPKRRHGCDCTRCKWRRAGREAQCRLPPRTSDARASRCSPHSTPSYSLPYYTLLTTHYLPLTTHYPLNLLPGARAALHQVPRPLRQEHAAPPLAHQLAAHIAEGQPPRWQESGWQPPLFCGAEPPLPPATRHPSGLFGLRAALSPLRRQQQRALPRAAAAHHHHHPRPARVARRKRRWRRRWGRRRRRWGRRLAC